MATRELLSDIQRIQFTQIPIDISDRDIVRYYTFNTDDLKVINSRRRVHNRLGMAVQLCYLRFPGRVWELGEDELRRYATFVAFLLETSAIFVDTAISMHDKMIGKLFRRSENQRNQNFQHDGKAINEKVRLYADIGDALINAGSNAILLGA